MNEEQNRIALAEHEGRTWFKWGQAPGETNRYLFFPKDCKGSFIPCQRPSHGTPVNLDELPDYLNDINAMHAALASQDDEFNRRFDICLRNQSKPIQSLSAKWWAETFLICLQHSAAPLSAKIKQRHIALRIMIANMLGDEKWTPELLTQIDKRLADFEASAVQEATANLYKIIKVYADDEKENAKLLANYAGENAELKNQLSTAKITIDAKSCVIDDFIGKLRAAHERIKELSKYQSDPGWCIAENRKLKAELAKARHQS